MRAVRRSVLFVAMLVCAVVVSFAAADGPALAQGAPVRDLVWASSPVGGTWYSLSAAIGETLKEIYPDLRFTQLPSGGSGNVTLVATGRADMAITQSLSLYSGYMGLPPFDRPLRNLRYVLSLYPAAYHFAVPASSPIRTFSDIRGKSLTSGTAGFTGYDILWDILDAYGWDRDDITIRYTSFPDGISLVKDGHLDVFAPNVDIPFSGLQELAAGTGGVRLISIDEDKIPDILSRNAGYRRAVIPANTYPGQTEPAVTIGVETLIIAREDLPADFVYAVVKRIFETASRYGQIAAALRDFGLRPPDDFGVPLHEGARRYYEEQGLL